MNEQPDAENQQWNSEAVPLGLKHPKTTKPPYYHPHTKTYQEEIGRLGHRCIRRLAWVIRWIDQHNGIVTAVATAVIAYLTLSLAQDSARQAESATGQLRAIQGQLNLATAQLRARLRLEKPAMHPVTPDRKLITGAGQPIGGWDVNPSWTNVGGTDARNVVTWWDMKIARNVKSILDCPRAPAPKGEFVKTIINRDGPLIEMSKFLSLQDLIQLHPGDKAAIFLFGRAEYSDILKAPHFFDWCLVAIPNDFASSTFSFLRVREETDD